MLKIIFIILIFTFSFAISSASYFVQNKGQFAGDVLFLSELDNLNIAIKSDGIYFDQRGKDISFVSMMKIEGADYSFPEIKYGRNGRINFLRGNDKSKWVTGLRPISEIIFRDILEDISLRLYFEEDNLRYDFILSPNADPNIISINFPESSPKISKDSTLILENPIGKIEHKDLRVFYKNNKNIIKSSFIINNNQIKFNLPDYDKNKTLIIDPLIYSTIIGGSDYDYGIELDINKGEEIAVIGETKSINFPASLGVYQDTLSRAGFDDIFIIKYDKFFNCKFITYIGGTDNEIASSVQILDDGTILGFGSSKSLDFPVAGNPLFSKPIGGYDLVFFKLSENGNILDWSSYFGSETDDFASKMKVFKNSDFYIAANINEPGSGERIPTSPGMLSNSDAGNYAGKIDGYIAKILSDGSQLLFATIIGGLNDDFIHDMDIDSSGNVFICGETRSVNYPTSEYALDRSYNDNQNDPNVSDAFFSKISSDGDSLKYSSLIGGTRTDKAYGLAVDEFDNIYIAGSTSSLGFPTSDEAYARELNNGALLNKLPDIFCTKIYTGGNDIMQLVYSTYIGGEASDRARAVDIDLEGNAYLTGSTSSPNLETTELAFDSDLNDTSATSDIFIIKLSPNGNELRYSSYFGGVDADNGLDIKVSGENNVFITGESSSTYFPVSKDAFQAGHQDDGKTDAIFFNLFLETPQDADYTICKGESVRLDSKISSVGNDNLKFFWSPPDYLDDPRAEFPISTPPKSIQYSCLVTLEDDFNDVVELVVSVVPDVNTKIFGKTEVQNGKIFTYSAPNHFGSTYDWEVTGGEIIAGNGSYFVAVRWSDADNGVLRLEETNSWSCKGYASFFTRYVTDWVIEKVAFGDFAICEGDTIVIDGGSQYYNFLWNDGTQTQLDTIWNAGEYWFGAKNIDGTDFNSEIMELKFLDKPIPPIIEYIEETKSLQCYSISTFYQWYRNGVAIPNATARRLIISQDGDYYLEITSENGCKNISETITVIITSVRNIAEPSFLIFPNPAQDNFNIISDNFKIYSKLIKIEIFDGFGKLQKELIYNSNPIDVSGLVSGVYFIRINNSEIQKLVIY